ncbi:unnamed protein product, partial [Prorocentrum cordatum]
MTGTEDVDAGTATDAPANGTGSEAEAARACLEVARRLTEAAVAGEAGSDSDVAADGAAPPTEEAVAGREVARRLSHELIQNALDDDGGQGSAASASGLASEGTGVSAGPRPGASTLVESVEPADGGATEACHGLAQSLVDRAQGHWLDEGPRASASMAASKVTGVSAEPGGSHPSTILESIEPADGGATDVCHDMAEWIADQACDGCLSEGETTPIHVSRPASATDPSRGTSGRAIADTIEDFASAALDAEAVPEASPPATRAPGWAAEPAEVPPEQLPEAAEPSEAAAPAEVPPEELSEAPPAPPEPPACGPSVEPIEEDLAKATAPPAAELVAAAEQPPEQIPKERPWSRGAASGVSGAASVVTAASLEERMVGLLAPDLHDARLGLSRPAACAPPRDAT